MSPSKTKTYKHAPLVMAVIDISFADIPNFHGNCNDELLAESLFSHGFTERKKVIQNGFEVKIADDVDTFSSQSSVEAVKTSNYHWVFLNEDRTNALHVFSNKIVLKCTDYHNFDEFIETFNKCFTSCELHISLLGTAPIKRIGARYVNFIVPNVEQDISVYICDEWAAPSHFLKAKDSRKLMMSRTTQFIEDEDVKLRIDSAQFEPGNGMKLSLIPDDLADADEVALKLKFVPWAEKAIQSGKSYVILDIDAFYESNLAKERDITSHLSKLRQEIRNSFGAYTTDLAEQEWDK